MEDDIEFLKGLHKDIWKHHPPRGNDRYGWSEESRLLTDEEMTRVLDISGRLPVTLFNACMGFGIGMGIYSLPDEPMYPGVTKEPPSVLFHMTSKHIPGVPPIGHDHFHKGWQLFSVPALRPQNIEWCKEFGLEAPRNHSSYYDY